MENQLLIALSRNKLFRNIDISKIELQNVKGKLITISEGEILYREGDSAEIIFLLVSGQINILKKRLLGKTKSYLFRENDFFGHEEYFEETSRTSTAVALVDSYLISLTRDEIDAIVKQNDEILVNLKEPVPENFIEELLQKESELAKKTEHEKPLSDEQEIVDNEPVLRPTVVDDGKTMDFFQSISDFSRRNDSNIIQPLEKFKNTFEDISEPEETPALENHIEPPQEEIEQSEVYVAPEPEQVKVESPVEKMPFDENAFLNEDGIPKAEFELPEVKEEPHKIIEPEKKSDSNFDDALFQILSGGDLLNYDTLLTKEEEAASKIDETSYHDFLSFQPVKEVQPEIETKFEIPQVTDEKEKSIQLPKEEEQLPEIKIPVEEPEPRKKATFDDEPPTIEEESFSEIKIHAEEPTEMQTASFEDYSAGVEPEVEPVKHELPVIEEIKFSIEETDNTPLPSDFMSSLERVFSSLNQADVYRNIIDSGRGITSANFGILYHLDWTKNELYTLVESGFGKRELRLKIGEGLAGSSAKNGEAVIVNNLETEMRFKFDIENKLNLDIKKLLVFPIKDKKNEIVAILELIKIQPEDFKPVDEEKLETLSIFFATALKNVKIVQAIINKERSLSLNKVSNFLEQEIKKPLLASKRYVEHLKTKNLQPDINHVIDLLSEHVNQVSDVVTTTANYSENKMPLRITNVSLNSTLSDFSLKAGQFVESKLCQIVNEFGGDTTVKMDIKEFFQCYMNLIKNGCEAMPDGGKIFVTTKKRGRNIEIHIKDNGCGIGDELKPKIFEPFMSEGKKDGTGLGLAIAKKVVEAHNGSIYVNSQIGEGADFVILLPIVSAF
jgi:signal transduction histidine kinase/CRP-like cAMP-binding protein